MHILYNHMVYNSVHFWYREMSFLLQRNSLLTQVSQY